MNARSLSALRQRFPQSASPQHWSRRTFVRTAGASIAAGLTLGGDILRPRRVEAAAPDDPLPIPGGSPTLGGAFHVYGPSPTGFLDPIDAEPASITNFNGVVGLAYIDGMVTQTRVSNGEQKRYPFVASDMRFMQGVYRGVDGKPRQGTFGFI